MVLKLLEPNYGKQSQLEDRAIEDLSWAPGILVNIS
jgi:hypothetical protein